LQARVTNTITFFYCAFLAKLQSATSEMLTSGAFLRVSRKPPDATSKVSREPAALRARYGDFESVAFTAVVTITP
jgi:hypothetical protein